MASVWIVAAIAAFFLTVALAQENPCNSSGLVLSGSSGFFWSPNFPNSFPANSNCTWNITVRSVKIIKMSFLSFTLESGQNKDCAGASAGSARVSITNVASDNGKTPFQLCGQRLPAPVYSEGNSIQVRFVSGSNVERGFNASYEAMNKDLLCPRNMILNESSGSITSPFYPRLYPDKQMCSWQITAKQGNCAKLEITNYNIQECGNSNCTCDYLQVLNGSSNATGKICGVHKKNITYYSCKESLTVLFVSDSTQSKSYDGFEATYQQFPGCPRNMILNETSGSINYNFYPGFYRDNQTCSWQIKAKQGNHVKLEITEYNIQQCGPDCMCDYLQVQNGFSADYPMPRICGVSGRKPITYYSLKESLTVLFVSDSTESKSYDGFEATYQQLNHSPPICPKEAIPLSGSGTFSSPNYPMSNYSASTECTWKITAPAGKYVKLLFTDFALSSCADSCSSANCSYVELYDGGSDSSPSLRRFCGGPTPQPAFSSGHQMFVKFHSGLTVDRGFEALYSVVSTVPTPTTPATPATRTTTTPDDRESYYWQVIVTAVTAFPGGVVFTLVVVRCYFSWKKKKQKQRVSSEKASTTELVEVDHKQNSKP